MGFARPDYVERRGHALDAWVAFWRSSREEPPAPRRVLEIGGAGLPAAPFLTGFDERHGLDPLIQEYARLFGDAPRGAPVQLREGRAEDLPYEDGAFDAVVMLNVLDHVEDPEAVLGELRRVLRPRTGLAFLSCDTYAASWLALRALRVALKGKRNNDVLHPHHFTERSFVRRVARRFRLLEVRSAFGDPLAGEHSSRAVYPLEGLRPRLQREARVYVAACLP
jgi:SAM-dependent methyltransferase